MDGGPGSVGLPCLVADQIIGLLGMLSRNAMRRWRATSILNAWD